MTEESHTHDLERILDAAPVGGFTALLCALCSCALIFDGFDIQAIAFAAPALLAEWGMTRGQFALVLAGGLLGMGLGAMLFGMLGDRVGRRRALIACMSLIAVASLLSAYASGREALAAWRLLTGLGLGGALPNAAALMMEFAPARWRNLIVATTVVGVPVGGMVGSLVASVLIPRFGWQSIFLVGAVAPACLTGAMVLWLAESPRYLAARPARHAELANILNRLTRSGRFRGSERWEAPHAPASRPGIAALYVPEYRRNTLLIWLIFFTNVLSVYSFFNWTPALLTGSGLALATALRGAFLFNLGGVVAAIGAAIAMTILGSRPVLLALSCLAVASTLAIGQLQIGPAAPVGPLFLLLFVAGACISGQQVQMYTVAAYTYPTRIRSTGIGTALGVARPGGILSSFAGPVLLAFGGGLTPFFTGIGLVLTLTFVGVLLLGSHLPPSRTRRARH